MNDNLQYDVNGDWVEEEKVGGDMFYKRRDPNEPIMTTNEAFGYMRHVMYVTLGIFTVMTLAFFFSKILTVYNSAWLLLTMNKLYMLPEVIKQIFTFKVIPG